MSSDNPSKRNSPSAASFQDPRTGRFKKGHHWREHKLFREKKYLHEQYISNGRSTGDIAAEWGVTDSTIIQWLRKHDIPRRTISQARYIKRWGARGANNPMYGRCGDKNPRYIDGSSPERQRVYARSFWKELVKVVYGRDGYKCVRCGAPQTRHNRLHAHHIKPWAGNPQSRLDLNNLIALCRNCHTWVHSKKNLKDEFLSR